jgi:predicted transcriptional regulator
MYRLEERPRELGNRTRVEILASILGVAHDGALKTHIMYKANLSHKQLQRYLGFLMESNLLERVQDSDTGSDYYRITERGVEFLKDYNRLSAHLIRNTP